MTMGPSKDVGSLAALLSSSDVLNVLISFHGRWYLFRGVQLRIGFGLGRGRYDLRSATSPRDIQDLDSSVRDADCGVRTGIVREKKGSAEGINLLFFSISPDWLFRLVGPRASPLRETRARPLRDQGPDRR